MDSTVEASPSLKFGSKSLRNIPELSVIPLTKRSLKVCQSSNQFQQENIYWQCSSIIPATIGPMFCTRVLQNFQISRNESERIHKPKYLLELEFDIENIKQQELSNEIRKNYDAGDSYCVLFKNPKDELDFLFKRFDLTHIAECQHELIWTDPMPAAFKYLPKYITPMRLFSEFLDIRRPPSRSLIRSFADFATDPIERRRLLELASKEGAADFTKFIRQVNLSLSEFICAFPSIKPPLDLLIELLPRLLPRHYTLTNYIAPKENKENYSGKNSTIFFRFTYSLLLLKNISHIYKGQQEFEQKQRYGVCSQWLLERKKVNTKGAGKISFPPLFSPSYALPSSAPTNYDSIALLLQIPLLMIGPGTGIAPFIAFLEKISHLNKMNMANIPVFEEKQINSNVNRTLIYASSCLEDEFLFKNEIERFKAEGVLSNLVLCESRPTKEMGKPSRIYDALREKAEEMAQFLMDDAEMGTKGGLLYACGDVKNMSRELWACLSEILQEQRGLTPLEANAKLADLRKDGRLIEDVWS